MIPQLIFFDLDGTLIRRDGTISPAVLEGIRRVKSLGTKIAFATGRPLFGARQFVEQVGIDALSAFFSGALIYDPVGLHPVHQWSLDSQQLSALIEGVHHAGLYLELHSASDYYVERWTDRTDLHLYYLLEPPIVAPLAQVASSTPIVKFCIIAERGDEEVRMRALMEKFPQFHYGVATGAAHDTILFSNGTSPDARREKVFSIITESLGVVPERVMSFGDGESDRIFISLAGTGVAMGNAPDAVKASADFVTAGVEDDGVLHALRHLVFEGSGR